MGIDYGLGKSNIDNDTGIRYGVIQADKVGSYWYDESEPYYLNDCPFCGSKNLTENKNDCDSFDCIDCEAKNFNLDEIEPVSHFFKDDKIQAEQSQDSPDIFVFKSEYYTICSFCSPCAPGAGYLTDESQDCKAYCFGHDWFESGKAPYKVYRVSDNSLVMPENTGE